MALEITGVTISAEIADKEYGKGSECFMNMSGKCPSPLPLTQIDEVIVDSLDMFFACWQTLLASRYAAGRLPAEDFNKKLEASQRRLKQIRTYYKKEIAQSE